MAVGASELERLELGWRGPADWKPGCKTQGKETDIWEGKE